MKYGLMTSDLIRDFIANGFVVVPDILSPEEVQECRDSLHARMLQLGFDYHSMTAEKFRDMPRFGCHTEIFYPDFKFAIHENPAFFHLVSDLFEATYAAGIPGFSSPFTDFNPRQGYMYIDRVNCRLPDGIKEQGGLGLHVDCNPLFPFDDPAKWRPIQASVVLTDDVTPTSGGLCVVPGMHTLIEEYVTDRNGIQSRSERDSKNNQHKRSFIKCSNFTRLDKCRDLTDRLVPVSAPAGSVILWDNRLPHATASQHSGSDTREVLFMTFLPAIPKNLVYANAQRNCFFSRNAPPDFRTKSQGKQEEPVYNFSPLGKKLMAIEPWEEEG